MIEAIKTRPLKRLEAPTSVIAKQVYQQLLPDFPAPAIQWVLRSTWVGPMSVKMEDIDTSNRANWTASHEPKKVALHQQLIKDGESNPIILAKLPGNDKLTCLDAHHRLLGYEALGRTPVAYVASVRPAEVEQALTMHSKQYTGGSHLDGA